MRDSITGITLPVLILTPEDPKHNRLTGLDALIVACGMCAPDD